MGRRRLLPGLLAALVLLPQAGHAGELSARANYLLRCSGCHLADGEGLPKSGIPAFPGYVDALAADDQGRTYMLHVPGVAGASLSDGETAAVLNYVVETWGTPKEVRPFTAQEVAARRAVEVEDVVRLRREIAARLSATGVKMAEYPWP